jgi:chorismate--pyruvate lyase
MFNPDKFQWRPFSVNENIPEHVLVWLLDSQSLTVKLRNKYDDFCVNVLSQQENNPYQCELKLLDINKKNTIIVREVELIGDSQAVVFARSVIPKTPDTEDILSIGSKPLGEILFNDKGIKRGHLEVGKYCNTWARRSTFTIAKTKLLVSEIFLEHLYA